MKTTVGIALCQSIALFKGAHHKILILLKWPFEIYKNPLSVCLVQQGYSILFACIKVPVIVWDHWSVFAYLHSNSVWSLIAYVNSYSVWSVFMYILTVCDQCWRTFWQCVVCVYRILTVYSEWSVSVYILTVWDHCTQTQSIHCENCANTDHTLSEYTLTQVIHWENCANTQTLCDLCSCTFCDSVWSLLAHILSVCGRANFDSVINHVPTYMCMNVCMCSVKCPGKSQGDSWDK